MEEFQGEAGLVEVSPSISAILIPLRVLRALREFPPFTLSEDAIICVPLREEICGKDAAASPGQILFKISVVASDGTCYKLTICLRMIHASGGVELFLRPVRPRARTSAASARAASETFKVERRN